MKLKYYYIKTYGCQMNFSDSERIATVLKNMGLKSTDKISNADLIIYNTCSVRQSAEDRILGLKKNICELKRKKAKKYANYKLPITVLTGCMCKRSWNTSKDEKYKERKYLAQLKRSAPWVDIFLQISEIDKLKKIINTNTKSHYLNLPADYTSSFKAYIPISTGCDEFCSYCIVPYARGKQIDRPASVILKEVKMLIQKGYKDITLLGQNVNSWENPEKSNIRNFLDLLKAVDNLEENFWLSFLSSHPRYVNEEFIDYFTLSCNKGNRSIQENKKFTKGDHLRPYFNLALQSGSDKILKSMNRKYTYEKFLKIAKKLKKKIPNLNLSTDIIVGFPGESKKDFNLTKKAFKDIKFDMAYINKYSPRKGTASYKLEDNVSWMEKKRRAKELTDILRKTAYENNKKYTGKKVRVLIERINKKERKYLAYGKTFNFKDIEIPMGNRDELKIGEFANVRVNEIKCWSLLGEQMK